MNVKKIKPTVKFYGKGSQRRITVLENEQAVLPLRLTGDGVPFHFRTDIWYSINLTISKPWRIKYRVLQRPDQSQIARLESPNDYLRVTEKGIYEILEVCSFDCRT